MKIKKIIKRLLLDKYFFLLILLSFVLLASVARYAVRTYKIPEWDEQHYMRMTTEFYRMVKDSPSFETPYKMLQVVPFRQPGYPILILPFLLVFGLSNSYFWGIFTNGLLYIASIFGIYFLARNFMSKQASFMASFIFATYGWTLLHLHLTYSETASSAFTIWTILFLIKSDLFQNRRNSVVFGVFLGLSLLVRWITLEYLLGPLLLVLYLILRKKLYRKREILINSGSSFLIALVISIYPYYQNYYWIFNYFRDVSVGSPVWQALPQDETNPFSLYSLTFYLNTFAQLGVLFFILIIAGFFLAFKSKNRLKPILLVVIFGYLFSVFAPIKGERYIVPIYPYLAILSAFVFDHIKNIKFRISLIALAIILSVVSFLGSTWGKGPMRQSLASLPIELPFGELKKIYLTTYSRPPYIYKISGKEILDFIEKDSKKSGIKNPQILSLFYYRPLDEPLMTYNLYNQEKILAINNFVGTVINEPENQAAYFTGVIKNTDYILIKSGQRVDTYFSKENYGTLKALITLFDHNPSFLANFEEKKIIWIYQDSSQVSIFKKKTEIPSPELEAIRLKLADILKTMKE